MNLVTLSDSDLEGVYTLFNQFHDGYAPIFEVHTKNVASTAKDYLQGQLFIQQQMNMLQFCREVPDSEYEAMQHFISSSPWNDNELRTRLQSDVSCLLASPDDGALVLDESGIKKQGRMSVGVARQYCGCLGKVDNCQVGVYLAYANSHQTSLIDYRLYLPESWVDDDERRKKCGVPDEIQFQTKAQLGLEMILAFQTQNLDFGWVSMDAFYGEQPWFLKRLTDEGIVYMADIPCNTRIFTNRPSTAIPLRKGNRGRHPIQEKRVEGEFAPIQVRSFAQGIKECDWTRLMVREIERGWLIADFATFRVWHSVDNLPFQEVWLIVRRSVGDNATIRFSFSNAEQNTPLIRLATMQCRRYWVERALQDAKGEAGLDQYQVRGWRGWHHHMAMTLLAMLFLLQLTIQFREKAPLLTIQDAREILETFLPRNSYSSQEFVELLRRKHQMRLSARRSHAKKQKRWLDNIKT